MFFCSLVFLVSCSKNKIIFEISKPQDVLNIVNKNNDDNNISDEEIKLTFNEKMNSHYKYSEIKTISENENFKAVLILSQKAKDEFYHILVRSINKDDKIIDTFLLASLNKKTKEFCSGSVTENLKVNRKCESVNFIIEKQFDKFGNLSLIKN